MTLDVALAEEVPLTSPASDVIPVCWKVEFKVDVLGDVTLSDEETLVPATVSVVATGMLVAFVIPVAGDVLEIEVTVDGTPVVALDSLTVLSLVIRFILVGGAVFVSVMLAELVIIVPPLVAAPVLEDVTLELLDEVELSVVDVVDICSGVVDELEVVVDGVLVVVVVVGEV